MDDCILEKCEVRVQVEEIAKGVIRFQNATSESIKEFKVEVREAIKDVDRKTTKRIDRLEDETRSEVQRLQLTSDARLDKYVSESTKQFLHIESSLGEIKGALGLKADGKDLNDVTQRIQTTRNSVMKNVNSQIASEQKSRNKLLYTIIGLLSSGVLFLLGFILEKMVIK